MIHIGRAQVSPEQPFIIAEVGSNWTSLEDCLASIEAAAKCGASAVKFQAYNFQALYGLGPDHMPKGYSKQHELPLEWLPKLKNKADLIGIEFMCTAFDVETMKTLDQYVNAHKIASSDLNHRELLDMAVRLRKPVFLSTGAATEGAITLALTQLKDVQTVLMYCVAAYPAPSVNLFVMDELKKFGRPVGFSDHTKDTNYLPLSAVKNHGAVAIEKHFSIVAKDTPDAGHSIDELGLATLCDLIMGRRVSRILPADSERDMLLRHKRRLIATKEIREGERLVFNSNYGVYRSLQADINGLQPHMADEIHGRMAVKGLYAGEPISISHVRF